MNRPEPEPAATVSDISDAALMRQLADGDASALGPLHQRYGRMVTSLMLRFEPIMSMEQAEDLTQEVYLTLFETAGRYAEQGKLKSWLCGIAVRKTRSWRRRTWLRRELLQRNRPRGDHAGEASSSPASRVSARQQVGLALESLPPEQREALVLFAVEGLSGEEIAAVLGIKPGAVWVRIHRARQRVRAALAAADEAGGKER